MGLLALGVAFWILPRFPGGSRGSERLAQAAIVLVNLGILRVAFQCLTAFLLRAGWLCEAAGGLAFAAHAWWRIKPLYP